MITFYYIIFLNFYGVNCRAPVTLVKGKIERKNVTPKHNFFFFYSPSLFYSCALFTRLLYIVIDYYYHQIKFVFSRFCSFILQVQLSLSPIFNISQGKSGQKREVSQNLDPPCLILIYGWQVFS